MTDDQKRISAVFFRTEGGAEPVRDWLKSLSKAERLLIGHDIKDVEYGWPIGMPTCRSLGSGLHEVRTNLPSRRTARVIFSIRQERMVLLHGFIKKSRRTPKADLELARRRKNQWERHHGQEEEPA